MKTKELVWLTVAAIIVVFLAGMPAFAEGVEGPENPVIVGGLGIAGLILGCALRTLLPYVVVGLNAIKKGGWSAWPKFDPAYLSAFGIAVIAYGVTLITMPGAWTMLCSMPFILIVALAYAGQDLSREMVKLFKKSQ